MPSFSGGDKDAGSGGPGRWAGHAGRCLQARQMGAVSVEPIFPAPPNVRRAVPTMGRRGLSCGWIVHEPLHVGFEDRGKWSLLRRERLCLRGQERKERSGICRQGLSGSRPRGMRWAESILEPADSLSWAGPNGQRKPPLAWCWASPPLQKRRRDAAYGTVLFVPGRLLNSYHTFHMCTSASHCLLLSAPPRLSGCAFITSAVSTRPPSLQQLPSRCPHQTLQTRATQPHTSRPAPRGWGPTAQWVGRRCGALGHVMPYWPME